MLGDDRVVLLPQIVLKFMRNYSGPAWSPDGRYLALTDRTTPGEHDSIYFVSVESGKKTKVTWPGTSVVGDYSPGFSPDGRMSC